MTSRKRTRNIKTPRPTHHDLNRILRTPTEFQDYLLEDRNKTQHRIKRRNSFEFWTIALAIILLLVTVLPTQDYAKKAISLMQNEEYSLDLYDGPKFEFQNSKLEQNRFYEVQQKITHSYNEERIVFTHSIENLGKNNIRNSSIDITIVDPTGFVRSKKFMSLREFEKKRQFKTIFNLPPSNEKLYGEWNVYSVVSSNNEVFSLIKMPVEVQPDERTWLAFFLAISVALISLGLLFWGSRKVANFI